MEEKIKKDIEKKIKRLIKAGKSKEAMRFKSFHEKEDLRDAFFNKLFFMNYSDRKRLFNEAKAIADKLPELRGWPSDSRKFWDVESYGWEARIPLRIREFIKEKLSVLQGRNLSLGSGNYPYVRGSVLVDFSREMLNQADAKEKIVLDLDKEKLPFEDKSFDSVTMVFVVDYLRNLDMLLKEVKRVLKKDGKLVIVNTKKPIDDYYRIQEAKHYAGNDLKGILKDFNVEIHEKRVLNRVLVFVEASS
ncbi:class I SAM-dependent methyltransferase [Candidatus Woesearchaeota archaeon]|nr:class I SAM-dependent methyltransferase [Candidatus Woesearchaeota archaeon]